MANHNNSKVIAETPVLNRSRKANRRTLKGCITQIERIQQQIRNVCMQYTKEKPIIFKALHTLHESLDLCKPVLTKVGNEL